RDAPRPGPSRRRYLARRWIALLLVLAVLGLTYVIMFTSLIGVRTVEVHGTREISARTVRDAADVELGTPMVRLDTDEVVRRVATLRRVFEVSVSRSLPSTVEIHVTERTPVAVVPDADGVHLVDRTGADYATVPTRPRGLPVLTVTEVGPDDPATRAAVTVLGAIPDQLRKRVVEVSARTPGDVRLKLAKGRVVKWGDAEDNERKVAVLAPLLTRPGRTYDVATPDFPTVS
ncbi:cell division protein FtsQ/DivIB, partial [Actinophytocola sp.]|uniref:cell division protein FtsQ/DivIB n=1 Tax=Actinophytocola sp. TaxID=1872138 RepID=UPI003D6BDF66